MLDLQLIRRDPESVRTALLKRMDSVDLEPIIKADEVARKLMAQIDGLRSQRNQLSEAIARARANKEPYDELKQRSDGVNNAIAELEPDSRAAQDLVQELMMALPNMPADEVIPGGKENNKVVRVHGEKPQLGSWAQDHMQISKRLGLVDHDRGVKLGGAGFWVYVGAGAALEWALLNYFCSAHYARGYRFVLPPHLLTAENGYAAGQFPKFYDDVFHIQPAEDGRERFLLPTAETALLNLYRDDIIDAAQLPLKLFAYTPCYRREGGGARAEERGTVRGHQFNKVEMFHFVEPEGARDSLSELVDVAESLMKELGLHFRTSELAAKDISATMVKTFDVEVWLPSIGIYKEVSSVSWAGDFQARRAKIRYRKSGASPRLVHTLNASGLATSRLLPAILEQFQQADGSVVVPVPLRQWLGCDTLMPPSPRS